MERLVLRLFRLAIVIGLLTWAVESGDLSQRARAFVETAVANVGHSIER
jgi:hypothetical protein